MPGTFRMNAFGEWRYTVDSVATREAYSREPAGGAATCSCIGCRNFAAARARILPDSFVQFLSSLGIDPTKEAEAYHCGRKGPSQHSYGGWYHFVGSLEVTGNLAHVDFGDGFISWMSNSYAAHIDSLDGVSLVQLEFFTDRAPWVLEEDEPD
jgi:hypothetical protein